MQPEAKLRAVIEITRSLAGTVDLQAIVPLILDTLFSIFPQADRGCVLLKDVETGQMVPVAQKHRRADADETVKLSRTILNKVLKDRTGILSADATSDSRFEAAASISSLTIRSMMCVPLLGLDGEPMGVINLDTQDVLSRFTKDDLDLLLAVAGQAALSYESARLLTSHMEKLKQDSEIAIAKNVQQALLPKSLPQVAGYDFFASYDTALAVGGDYYDAILLDNGKICLSFGDVAGKGVPASLVMSRISSVVQSTLQLRRRRGRGGRSRQQPHVRERRRGALRHVHPGHHRHALARNAAGHRRPHVAHDPQARRHDRRVRRGIGGHSRRRARRLSVRRLVAHDRAGRDGAVLHRRRQRSDESQGRPLRRKRVREFLRKSHGTAAEIGKALLADVRTHANGRAAKRRHHHHGLRPERVSRADECL